MYDVRAHVWVKLELCFYQCVGHTNTHTVSLLNNTQCLFHPPEGSDVTFSCPSKSSVHCVCDSWGNAAVSGLNNEDCPMAQSQHERPSGQLMDMSLAYGSWKMIIWLLLSLGYWNILKKTLIELDSVLMHCLWCVSVSATFILEWRATAPNILSAVTTVTHFPFIHHLSGHYC